MCCRPCMWIDRLWCSVCQWLTVNIQYAKGEFIAWPEDMSGCLLVLPCREHNRGLLYRPATFLSHCLVTYQGPPVTVAGCARGTVVRLPGSQPGIPGHRRADRRGQELSLPGSGWVPCGINVCRTALTWEAELLRIRAGGHVSLGGREPAVTGRRKLFMCLRVHILFMRT